MKKITIKNFVVLILLMLSFLVNAKDLPAGSGVSSSSNTLSGYPASNAVDGNPETAWKLVAGSQEAWLSIPLTQKALIYGLKLNCNITANNRLYLEYNANNKWVLFNCALIKGQPAAFIDLSAENVVTDKIRIRLEGSPVSESVISEVDILGLPADEFYYKIKPQLISSTIDGKCNSAAYLTDGDLSVLWQANSNYLNGDKSPELAAIMSNITPPAGGYEMNAEFDLMGKFNLRLINIHTLKSDAATTIQVEVLNNGQWVTADKGYYCNEWWRADYYGRYTGATKARIKMTTNEGIPGGIGEIEFYGFGEYAGDTKEFLQGSPVEHNQDLNYTFNGSSDMDHYLEIGIEDISANGLDIRINGFDTTLPPGYPLHGNTLYTYKISAEFVNQGNNYVTLKYDHVTVNNILGIKLKKKKKNNYESTIIDDLTGSTGERTFDLGKSIKGASVRIIHEEGAAFSFYSINSNADTSRLTGTVDGTITTYPMYQLTGNVTIERERFDKFRITSMAGIKRIEICASAPAALQNGDIYIFKPEAARLYSSSELANDYFVGYLGDTTAVVKVNGLLMNRYGQYFWKDMNSFMLSGRLPQTYNIEITGNDGVKRTHVHEIQITGSPEFILYNTDDIVTNVDTINISGRADSNAFEVYVGDSAAEIINGEFNKIIQLTKGFNLVVINQMDKISGVLLKSYERKVTWQPEMELSIINPVNEFITSTNTIEVTGSIEGWGPFTVYVNGIKATIRGNEYNAVIELTDEGDNTIEVKAIDAGETEKITSITVKIDTQLPVINNLLPAEGSFTSLNTVSVSCNITDASAVEVYIDNVKAVKEENLYQGYAAIPGADGIKEISIDAIDAAGNITSTKLHITKDTTAPDDVNIITENIWWSNNNHPCIYFRSNDSLSGISHYEVSIDSAAPVVAVSPLQLSALTDGERNIKVYAINNAGLVTAAETKLLIDTTPAPVPAGFEAISGIGNITLKWEDDTEENKKYRIYRYPALAAGEYVELSRDNNKFVLAEYEDKDIIDGQNYTYRIQTIDKADNIGVISEEKNVLAGKIEKTINAAGATDVKFEDLAVMLEEATFNPLDKIVIEKTNANLPVNDKTIKVGETYSIKRIDQAGVELDEEFNKPVTLSFSYKDLVLPEGYGEFDLGIYYYDEENEYWQKVNEAERDLTHNTLKVKTIHFSDWGMFASAYSAPNTSEYDKRGVSPHSVFFKNHSENVNTASGSLNINAIDFILPGKNGFNTSFTRTYNSSASSEKRKSTAQTNEKEDRINAFSPGWELDIPFMNVKNKKITLPGGEQIAYSFKHNELVYHQGNVHFILRKIGKTGFKLFFTDGTSYNFDVNGKAIRKLSPDGKNWIEYHYDTATGKENNLTTITDSSGRTLTFVYATNSVTGMEVIDYVSYATGNTTYTYDYDYNENGELSVFTDPHGNTTQYSYEIRTGTSGYTEVGTSSSNVTYSSYTNTVYNEGYSLHAGDPVNGVISAGNGSTNVDSTTTYNYHLLKKITYPTNAESLYVYDLYSDQISNDFSGGFTDSAEIKSNNITLDYSDPTQIPHYAGSCTFTTYTQSYSFEKTVTLYNYYVRVLSYTTDEAVKAYRYNNSGRVGDLKSSNFIPAGAYVLNCTSDEGRAAVMEKYNFLSGKSLYNETSWVNLSGGGIPLLVSKTIKDETNNITLETTEYEYDLTLQTPKEIIHKKDNTILFWESYTYDEWGNIKTANNTATGLNTAYVYSPYATGTENSFALTDIVLKNRVSSEKVTNTKPLENENYMTEALTTNYIYSDTANPDKPTEINITGNETRRTYFTYDGYGNLKTETKANNLITTFEYNNAALDVFPQYTIMAGVTDAANIQLGITKTINGTIYTGIITTNTYDQFRGLLTETVDSADNITGYEYDNINRLLKTTYNSRTIKQTEYIDESNLTRVYDDNNNQTELQYDNLDRLLIATNKGIPVMDKDTLTNNLTDTTNGFTYDKYGQIVLTKDQAGFVSRYDYDVFGRLTKVYLPDGVDTGLNSDFTDNNYTRLQYRDSENIIEVYEKDTKNNKAEVKVKEEQSDWAGRMTHVTQYAVYDGKTDTYNWSIKYDSNGNRVILTDAKGHATYQNYDALGRLVDVKLPPVDAYKPGSAAISYAFTPQMLYEYDIMGNKTGEISANGAALGSNGNKYKATTEYDLLERVIRTTKTATDPFTAESIISINEIYYDIAGNKVKEKTGNKEWSYTYNKLGKVLTITDPEGDVTEYTYDARGNKISETDPRGTATAQVNDYTTWFEYDSWGRLIKTILPDETYAATSDNPYTEIRYDIRGNKACEKSSNGDPADNGIITLTTYNSINKPEAVYIKDRLGNKKQLKSYTYDVKGNVIEETSHITNTEANTVKSEYDSLGRLRKTTLPDSVSIQTYSYDAFGNQTEFVNGENVFRKTTYNALGWVTSITEQGGAANDRITRYEYDLNGNKVRYMKPHGTSYEALTYKTEYDELNRVVRSIDALNQITTTSYDIMGNINKKVDVNNVEWLYTYSDERLSRVEAKKDNQINYWIQHFYDKAGNKTGVEDINGNTETYTVNYLNQITDIVEGFDGAVYTKQYRYNKDGTPDKVKYPETNEWINFSYDASGRLNNIQGFTTDSIEYDRTNSLINCTYANGITNNFAYDVNMRLQHITIQGAGNIALLAQEYGYDKAGNITSIKVNGLDAKKRAYTYDNFNQLTHSVIPEKYIEKSETAGTPLLLRQDYRGAKSLSAILSEEVYIDYDSTSIGLSFGGIINVKKLEIIPDKASFNHRIEKDTIELFISDTNTEYTRVPVSNYSFEKDNATGKITILLNTRVNCSHFKIHILFDDRDDNFVSINTYKTFLNELSNIIKVYQEADSVNESFEYDAGGNRIAKNLKLARNFYNGFSYYANCDHVMTDGKYAYTYDAMGNITEKGNTYAINDNVVTFTKTAGEDVEYWQYTYDLLNRLTNAAKNGVELARYSYNANGLRNVKMDVANNIKTHYIYENNNVVYEKQFTSTAAESRSYLYLGDTHLARIDGVIGSNADKYYYTTDHLGSIRTVTDEAGSIQWKGEYSPFGELLFVDTVAGYVTDNHLFTGKKYDALTDLYYYNARWYDPQTGRFVSEDPVQDGLNWYAYCGNNPVGMVDPTGRVPIYTDDINGNPIPVLPGVSMSSRFSVVYIRNSENSNSYKGYDNDSAILKIDNQILKEYNGIQSEKNMNWNMPNQKALPESERFKPDYRSLKFPNVTLPFSDDYTATMGGPGGSHPNGSSLTSDSVQLPDFPQEGVKASYGFMEHSYSTANAIYTIGWSLGCMVWPDAAFDCYVADRKDLGITQGVQYTVIIEPKKEEPIEFNTNGKGPIQ